MIVRDFPDLPPSFVQIPAADAEASDYVDIVWTAEQAKVVPATVRGWATRPVAFKHAVRTGMIDGILFPEPVGARAEATHLLLYRRTQVLAYLAERARRKKADRAVPS
jgi:hypothetical protein